MRQILEQYGDAIFGLLSALVERPDDSQDAFGEFCEQVWSSLGSFEGRSSVRTWLYVIARRTAYRARRQEPPTHSLERVELEQVSRLRDTFLGTTVFHLRALREKLKIYAANDLSSDERTLMIMRYGHGRPWEEVAEVLGISRDAAMARGARLIRRLKRWAATRGLRESAP